MERLRYLTAAEAGRLKEAVSTNRDRAIVGLLLHTGMRIGEVTGLQVRDFDREAQTIRIERIVVKTSSVVDRSTGEIRLKIFKRTRAYKMNKPQSIVLEDGTVKQVMGRDLPKVVSGFSEFVKVGTKAHGDAGRTVPLTDQKTWLHIEAEIEGRDRTGWAWQSGARGSAWTPRPGASRLPKGHDWEGANVIGVPSSNG